MLLVLPNLFDPFHLCFCSFYLTMNISPKTLLWIQTINISLFSCSFDPSLSYEEREKRMKQAAGRAGFMQDLLFTTLLGE